LKNTYFASPERDPLSKVLEQRSQTGTLEYMHDIISSLSFIVCILNEHRQVVFSNEVLLKQLGLESEEPILGARFGEIVGCLNAEEAPSGCGTGEACRYCGAVNSIILAQQKKEKVSLECRIIVDVENAMKQLDLEVTSSPLFFQGYQYTIVSAVDISEKKKRQLMERIFFHDVINQAGGLSGLLEIMLDSTCDEAHEYLNIAQSASKQLLDEIMWQQQLNRAEKGDLELNPKKAHAADFAKKIAEAMRHHSVSKMQNVDIVVTESADFVFKTDLVLLNRILTNMIKNAIEASESGDVVTVDYAKGKEHFSFFIHNKSFIPRHVQLQLFQRSYTTKGVNRGLGTYSMKLLGENYLKGHVSFVSTENEGTTFCIQIPLEIE